jgi:hypothetical protein
MKRQNKKQNKMLRTIFRGVIRFFVFIVSTIIIKCIVDILVVHAIDRMVFVGSLFPVSSTLVSCNGDNHFMIPVNVNTSLHAYMTKPKASSGEKLIFFMHGNAETIDGLWASVAETMAEQSGYKTVTREDDEVVETSGPTVVTYDYRRYGRSHSDNTQNEDNAISDAMAVLSYFVSLLKPSSIILYGRSVGAYVALHLAASHKFNIDSVLLETPFIGIRYVKHFYPVNMLVHDQYSTRTARACIHDRRDRAECRLHVSAITAGNDEIIDSVKIGTAFVNLATDVTTVEHATHNTVFGSSEWQRWFQDNLF